MLFSNLFYWLFDWRMWALNNYLNHFKQRLTLLFFYIRYRFVVVDLCFFWKSILSCSFVVFIKPLISTCSSSNFDRLHYAPSFYFLRTLYIHTYNDIEWIMSDAYDVFIYVFYNVTWNFFLVNEKVFLRYSLKFDD